VRAPQCRIHRWWKADCCRNEDGWVKHWSRSAEAAVREERRYLLRREWGRAAFSHSRSSRRKLARAGFTADRERLRRFEQEARAALALNHPNILTVYEFGAHDGSPYIVSELLEGEELREQLNDGAMSQRKLLLKGASDPTDWSPDGRFILYSLSAEKTRRDVWALPLTGDLQPHPLLNSEFDESGWLK